ncbi:MAG: Dps family protein [Bacteroidota bacterium]
MNNNIETAEVLIDKYENSNTEVVGSIKKLLADLHLQYHNLRNFHWHVTGPNFYILHEKFEELYTDIAAKVDETAERILALGSKPGAGIDDYVQTADIADSYAISAADDMVLTIVAGNEILIADVNKILKVASVNADEGTIDTFTSYVTELQKTNWMLKAFLG